MPDESAATCPVSVFFFDIFEVEEYVPIYAIGKVVSIVNEVERVEFVVVTPPKLCADIK